MSSVEAVVISLPAANERRKAVTENLKNLFIPWRFFDAVRGTQRLPRSYEKRDALIAFGRPLTDGEIGCFSSHLLALQEFLDRGETEWVVILEDDVLLDVHFPFEDFAEFNTRNGIDFVRLFGRFLKPYISLGYYFDRQIIRFRTSPAGTQAYMMSRKGAKQFLDSVKHLDTVYDIQLDRFWICKLPTYAIFPYPAIESFAPTSIPLPPRMAPMTRSDQLRYFATKIYHRANKSLGDVMLARRDRELMRMLPSSFRQVGVDRSESPIADLKRPTSGKSSEERVSVS